MVRETIRRTCLQATGLLAILCAAATVGTASRAQSTQVPGLIAAPEDGGPRRLETVGGAVRLYAAPSEAAEVVGEVADGTVLDNLGCEIVAQTQWCQVRPFRGGARTFARAGDLRPAAGPDGAVATGLDDSERRARAGDVDARARVPCAQERGQALTTCQAAVARGTGGDATVVATFPNGFARRLYFRHGAFVAANATMSGAGRDVDWRRDGDTHLIRVDDQRYELPDAFVFGP